MTKTLADLVASLGPDDACANEIKQIINENKDECVGELSESIRIDNKLGQGASMLHLACTRQNIECVDALLMHAHIPWNVVDDAGVSIGQVCDQNSHFYNHLVAIGVRTEFLLTAMGQRVVDHNDTQYLHRRLTFSDNKLLDSDGNAVMMGWEAPLMQLHCNIIAPEPNLDVLNVGFGLGIIDTMLQETSPRSHTIIEAHPDVYAEMIRLGWNKKPGVKILFGRWQDVLDQLETYDGIFFDTFGEDYDDLHEFHQVLPNHLRETGTYSFFNGLAGTNSFFHDVAVKVAELDLSDVGMTVSFDEVPVDTLGDDVWKETKRAYWSLPLYRVPTVKIDI